MERPRPPRKSAGAVKRARQLRRELTLPERLLWRALRDSPAGLRFRKQHPAGEYALDFYCPAARLCIEVDGAAHDMGDRPARDAERDAFLVEHGVQTLRIPATDVLTRIDDVVTAVILTAQERRR